MTPEPLTPLRARLHQLFQEHDIARMTMSEVWRLILESEVLDATEINELCREAEGRVIARVLKADPALRRRIEEEGGAALEEPRRAIERDLDAWEEREDR